MAASEGDKEENPERILLRTYTEAGTETTKNSEVNQVFKRLAQGRKIAVNNLIFNMMIFFLLLSRATELDILTFFHELTNQLSYELTSATALFRLLLLVERMIRSDLISKEVYKAKLGDPLRRLRDNQQSNKLAEKSRKILLILERL